MDYGNGLSINLGLDTAGNSAVVLTIPASTFIETPGGDPQPGIAMSAGAARELAFTFLLLAEQLSNRKR